MSFLIQFIGILAMVFSVLSYQMKTYKTIMIVQIITAVFFTAHYFLHEIYMADGLTAGVLNTVAIVRDVIFLFREKSKICAWRGWTVIFSAIMILFGALSWEGAVSLLFMAAMVLNTLSFSMRSPQSVRKIILFASPLAFLYNLFTGSVGGMINECLSEYSAIVGLIRFSKKKKRV